MIKVKLADIQKSKPVIEKLLKVDLKSKARFVLARIVKEIVKELETFQEAHNKKVQEFGEESTNAEGQQMFTVKPENMPEFLNQLNELLASEIDLNINKIDSAMLDEIPLSVEDLIILEWLIETENVAM